MAEICGKQLRAGKICGRRKDHNGQHSSIEAQEKRRAYRAAYLQANAERISERQHKYYLENAERLKAYKREYMREYNRENAAQKREYNREYRRKNTERISEWNREYRKEYNQQPENKARFIVHRQKRRALEASVYSEPYTRDDVLRAWGSICYLCDSIVPDDWHLEHVIPISKGGHDTVGNVRPACPGCNLRKQDKLHPIYQLAHCELVRAR